MAIPDAVLSPEDTAPIDGNLVLGSLPTALVIIAANNCIAYTNAAAEQLLCGSSSHLRQRLLSDFLPKDSPVFGLIDQVREHGNAVSEYGIALESPRIGHHYVNIQSSPLADTPDAVIVTIQERSIADKIDRQLTHRGAARSVSAMAAVLAHEIKNPLSGISGAAQLLEDNLGPEDRTLTQLIRDESNRICALVDRMEVFGDGAPLKRTSVNIHQVLNRVRQLADSGFGRHVRIVEDYDPSLPTVYGNHDQLIQVLLNLVKNAVESAPEQGGEIVLSTTYRHGVRFALSGKGQRVHLPLMISVQDNGDGISEDIQGHIFDPFVTSKPNGSGLGLALVAKIIDDHGGVIEFESRPRKTVFKIMLPMASDMAPEII
jgi:two-component system nitrogen regulation sensor histidine kinase GlnL